MLAASRKARVAALSAGVTYGSDAALGAPPRGWVPEGEPPEADTSWLDNPWAAGTVDEPPGPEPTDVGAGSSAGRHRRGPRVVTVPTPFRGARLAVPWRAVVAFAVVVLVAGVVFAVRVARAQEAAVPQVVPAGGLVGRTALPTAFGPGSSGGSSAGPSGGPPGALSAGASAPSTAMSSANASVRRSLVIDVVGQVVHPGVVSVPDGSRVADVLTAAGGALPDADVRRLNLARLVSDGEQLVVPRPGETPTAPLGANGGPGGSGMADPGASSVGSTSAAVVDLNTATLAALDGLPGVGPILAQRILDWRGQHGRFSSVDELGEVSGIGDKLLTQIRPRVRV